MHYPNYLCTTHQLSTCLSIYSPPCILIHSLSIHPLINLYIHVLIHLPIQSPFPFIHICYLPIHLSKHLPIPPSSIYPSKHHWMDDIYLSIHYPSIHLPPICYSFIHLLSSIYPSIHLSTQPFIHLSNINLSIHPPTIHPSIQQIALLWSNMALVEGIWQWQEFSSIFIKVTLQCFKPCGKKDQKCQASKKSFASEIPPEGIAKGVATRRSLQRV